VRAEASIVVSAQAFDTERNFDYACGSCEPQTSQNRSTQPSQDEVERAPTAVPVQPTSVDLDPGSSEPLPRPHVPR
jgi:hypothetical protein